MNLDRVRLIKLSNDRDWWGIYGWQAHDLEFSGTRAECASWLLVRGVAASKLPAPQGR